MQVANDASIAEVHVRRGAPASREQLDAALAAAGIVAVDAAAVAALATRLADADYAGVAVVARGSPAQAGRDGHLAWVCRDGLQAGRLDADGHIDFHERSLLCSTSQGSVVATIVPPASGVAGVDVYGRATPAPAAKAAAPRLGPGVRQEGDRIVAARDGVVCRGGDDKVDVVPLWKHEGNVDLHSGNLRITGTLVIRGDVSAGFAVAATGDVVVQGSVQDGEIDAGGAVVVGQAILGRSSVRAGGDLSCRHATGAALHAKGTVRLSDQAVHCTIAGDCVELVRGHGKIIGGEVRARRSINVRTAGTEAAAPTTLAVGEQHDEQRALVRDDAAAQRTARACRKGVLAGSTADRGGGQLGRDQVASAGHALARRLELASAARELLRGASITVHDRVHAGVCIRFGQLRLDVTEALPGTTFRWDEATDSILQSRP